MVAYIHQAVLPHAIHYKIREHIIFCLIPLSNDRKLYLSSCVNYQGHVVVIIILATLPPLAEHCCTAMLSSSDTSVGVIRSVGYMQYYDCFNCIHTIDTECYCGSE